MSERAMATIRRIDKIEPIEGADKIVKATVGGWSLVTAIDNGFKEGDLVVYCEIDSWIPHEIAPFLSKGKDPREFNGVKGEKLRTIKLRGQISQGLLLPLEPTCSMIESKLFEGLDVSVPLNIQKWEAPIPAQLAGQMKGSFPSFGRKTDQERIQNLIKEFAKWKDCELTFEVTEKLEGSSMTVYFNDGEFGVCSRNMDLKEVLGNTFWDTALKYNLSQTLPTLGMNLMIQGELIGPGVQGNIYKLTKHEFRVFDVFDIDAQEYLSAEQRGNIVNALGLDHVPFYGRTELDQDLTIAELLLTAEGKSHLADTEREGIVFKCIEVPEISFKAISNKYLLGAKD